MTRIHILTRTFDSPNTYAFVYPLLRHRGALRDAGITFQRFPDPQEDLLEADVLWVDGRRLRETRAWEEDRGHVLSTLGDWRSQVDTLAWFDTTASTGTMNVDAIPHVDVYFKAQLLEDKTGYAEPLYGARPYTDRFHEEHGIDDTSEYIQPAIPKEHWDKLEVFWNSSLAHYGRFRIELFRLHELTGLRLRPPWPWRWRTPSVDRPREISARFGASYDRETVRFQRQRVLDLIGDRIDTERVPTGAYFRELKRSKLALSPFGWGEKCYRDYEALLSGCLLVKPDMSHMETWPDLYRDDTAVYHAWDLADFWDVVDRILDDYESHVETAHRAQRFYRRMLEGESGEQAFVDRVRWVLDRS